MRHAWKNWLAAALLTLVAATGALAGNAQAPVFYYFDADDFFAETGATDITGPMPGGPGNATEHIVGAVLFQAHPPSTLNFSNFSAGLPDAFELALNGDEELNMRPASPVFALGFDIEEAGRQHPSLNATFIDSVFTVTLCAVTFARGSECPAVAVIASREFSPPDSNPPLYAPSFFGVWADAPIAQISIREASFTTDGNEFFGRVYAGASRRLAPDVDAFENDNAPVTASALAASLLNATGLPRYEQDHSIHADGDVDWIYFNTRAVRDFELRLTSNDPDFHPLVQTYDATRFEQPGALPIDVFGDCAGPPGNLEVTIQDNPSTTVRLLRVSQCRPEGRSLRYLLNYQVTRNYSFSSQQVAILSGSVLIASTNQPAGAFITSNNGEATFSSPATGDYSMTLTAGVQHVLTLFSPELETDPVIIPPPFQGQNIQLDFIVGGTSQIFADGFE